MPSPQTRHSQPEPQIPNRTRPADPTRTLTPTAFTTKGAAMGWIENLLRLFTDGASSPATTRAYGRVTVDDPTKDPADSPALPGTAYVQLWLQEAWLLNEREWLNTYAPVVQSALKFKFDTREVAFPATVGGVELGVGKGMPNLQDAVKLRYPLSPPIPYNGGAIEFAVGLQRKTIVDGLAEMVSSITQLARSLKVAELSTVLELISPVASVIESVLSPDDDPYVLGLHDSLSSDDGHDNPVIPGYFAVINVPDTELRMDQLKVVDGRLHWADGRPYRAADFMLLRLGVTPTRSDLRDLKEIFGPLKQAISNGVEERPDRARLFLQSAKLAALFSNELTVDDRKRLPGALEEEYRTSLQAAGVAGDGAGVGETQPVSVEDWMATVDSSDALQLSTESLLEEIANF